MVIPNGWDGILTITWLRQRLEDNCYRSLHKALSFAALFIDGSTKYNAKAPMTEVDIRTREIFADVTRDIRQQAWCVKDLDSL